MKTPSNLAFLVDSLRHLPGVGPKSAQRMAYHLLQHKRDAAVQLSKALAQAVDTVCHCERCHTFTQQAVCETCQDNTRDPTLLCVVETPSDQLLIEQTLTFKGLYFVLMGRLSPLNGIGPKDIELEKLMLRATDGIITEVILATNFTNEGEATAYYISEMLKARNLKVSRLARGVPVGSELEYVDTGTIAYAMLDRHIS